jgi:hypothetical protein
MSKEKLIAQIGELKAGNGLHACLATVHALLDYIGDEEIRAAVIDMEAWHNKHPTWTVS